ncbi:hypothetical protein BsWGS_25205 [Bradybaena similaris]
MSKKLSRLISDVPKEGQVSKKVQVVLSPTASDIETEIAGADPEYVDKLSREVGNRLLQSMRSRAQSFVGQTDQFPDRYGGGVRSLKSMSDEEMRLAISTPSRVLFGQHAKALDLMPFFHDYDTSVLSEEEMMSLRALAMADGNMTGATGLFDALRGYQGWLPCTLDVLRDGRVDMAELAELLLLHHEIEKATNAITDIPENAQRIADLIRDRLRMRLKPLEILHLFHKYDPKVLVQEDLDIVADVTRSAGNEVGSDELLDRLILYPGWYPCLMNVLKDPQAGLEDLAAELADIVAEEFPEIYEIQQRAEKALKERLANILARAKAEKKQKKVKRAKLLASELRDVSPTTASQGPGRRRRVKLSPWGKMMKHATSCPKYPGLDWDRQLAKHLLDHLPSEAELACQGVQLSDTKKDDVVPAPGLHETMLDPWVEGKKYAEKHALSELFSFMLSRLVLDTPSNPLEYLIDLTREINRLNKARQEVHQLAEAKKKCEEEAARRKSSLEASDQMEKVSERSQNEPPEAAGTQGNAHEP